MIETFFMISQPKVLFRNDLKAYQLKTVKNANEGALLPKTLMPNNINGNFFFKKRLLKYVK